MRQARITYEGAIHHVMSRGYNGLPIFKTDTEKDRLLELLEKNATVTHNYITGELITTDGKFGWSGASEQETADNSGEDIQALTLPDLPGFLNDLPDFDPPVFKPPPPPPPVIGEIGSFFTGLFG